MPNYEYKCVACEHLFELWQNVGDSAPPCPECGSEVKKVFHPPRVIFKGSGFYVTDLRAEKEGAKSSSKTAAASATSGEASAEKPAEKSETKPAETSSAPAVSPTPAPSSASSASANTASSADKKP